jgi:hypothetical protein
MTIHTFKTSAEDYASSLRNLGFIAEADLVVETARAVVRHIELEVIACAALDSAHDAWEQAPRLSEESRAARGKASVAMDVYTAASAAREVASDRHRAAVEASRRRLLASPTYWPAGLA